MKLEVTLTGGWESIANVLRSASTGMGRTLRQALKTEGDYLAEKVQATIRGGVPPPLKGRSGTPLYRTHALHDAIKALPQGDKIFVGVDPASGLQRIAAIHEAGATIEMVMTDKQRRYLFGVVFKGQAPQPGTGSGLLVITIPPRPFLAPTLKREQPGMVLRLLKSIAASFGGQLGNP